MMSKNSNTARERDRAPESRIPNFVHKEAKKIEALFSSEDTPADVRRHFGDLLCELSNETHVTTEHPAIVRAFYLQCVRVFHEMQETNHKDMPQVRRHFGDIKKALARVERGESVIGELREEHAAADEEIRERWRDVLKPVASAPGQVKRLSISEDSGQIAAVFGILGGDLLEIETVDAPRPGEVLILTDAGGARVGRFVRFDDEPGGREIVLAEEDGEESYHPVADFEVLRPLRVTRLFNFEAPEPRPAADGLSPEAGQRIETLRRKLDRLYEPENEAARFHIEREIYDLEHSLACAVDEWPDVIAA